MTEKTFTLSQIKQAYWAKFHESGELWFDYLGSEEENEEATNDNWDEFLKELEKAAQTNVSDS